MKRTISLLLSSGLLLGAGCPPAGEGDDASEFERALPTAAQLEIKGPTGTVAGGLADGTMMGGALGEVSQYYQFTAGTTLAVNLGILRILAPIRLVIETFPPSVVEADRAVWQGSGALDPQDHMLVVERPSEGHYEFMVLSRLKSPADSPWRVVVGGETTPGATPGEGQGSVWVDLDQDRDDKTTGKALAVWSRAGGEREVNTFFYAWSDDVAKHPARDATYYFKRQPEGGGVFVFGVPEVNIHHEASKSAMERALIASRWLPTGQGRSDVYADGGDVAADGYDQVHVTQCWAANSFETTYEQMMGDSTSGQSDVKFEAGDLGSCAFAAPQAAALPETPPAPVAGALPPEAQ